MKKLFCIIVLLVVTWITYAVPKIASTIDFLDYVFYDTPGTADHYPLQHWESRIKEMAEGGIDKLYLRVNVCGGALYPSKVVPMFGQEGVFYWEPEEAGRNAKLIKTLELYDPLSETIRLCRKYGVEIWAWESIWEDGNSWAYQNADSSRPDLVEKFGRYPFMDPFFRKNMHFYSMKNPRLTRTPEEIAALNHKQRSRNVGRIELISSVPNQPERKLNKENLLILTSKDNHTFVPYEGTFKLQQNRDKESRNRVIISGLKLTGPYFKLAHRIPLPNDWKYSISINSPRNNQCRVFDSAGQELKAVWGQVLGKDDQLKTSLDFNNFWSFAWDQGNSQLGFVLGDLEPELDGRRHFISLAEFAIPAVMEHKIARFRELTNYHFDGFMLNLRMHGHVDLPAEYGFNPELREQYLRLYKRDIWRDSFNRDKLNELRSNAFDEFLRNCKVETNGRPLFLSVVANTPKRPGSIYNLTEYAKEIGLKWHYERWFAENSVDGVVMIGDFFPERFQGRRSGGKPVKIGVFREMAFADKKFNFASDLKKLMNDSRLDEIELYETLEIVPLHRDRLKLIQELKKEANKK